jgi:hypothetical protein
MFVLQGTACQSGQYGPGGQTSQALATCFVRRTVSSWKCTDPVFAEGVHVQHVWRVRSRVCIMCVSSGRSCADVGARVCLLCVCDFVVRVRCLLLFFCCVLL